MIVLERYEHDGWIEIGRGRTPEGIARRFYGRRYGVKEGSGVNNYGLLIRASPFGGFSVEGRVRWKETR